jgi:hypothetical protein
MTAEHALRLAAELRARRAFGEAVEAERKRRRRPRLERARSLNVLHGYQLAKEEREHER